MNVIYIGTVSRSGSTLLDRLLGEIPGHFSGGELTYLWKRGWNRNELCGCGEPFRKCDHWKRIIDQFRNRMNGRSMNEMGEVVKSVNKHGQIPLYLWPFLRTNSFQRRVRDAREILGTLYDTIQQVTGDDVIVDSSKFPVYGFLLAGVENIDVYFAHLIRDARAVANSWQRKKQRPEIHWEEAYFERYNPVTIALAWIFFNACLLNLGAVEGYAQINYESLALNPEESLIDLTTELGLGRPELHFLEDGVASFETNHTVSGNPMRFKTGDVEIKLDDDWIENLGFFSKSFVTGLTFPFLKFFGYSTSIN